MLLTSKQIDRQTNATFANENNRIMIDKGTYRQKLSEKLTRRVKICKNQFVFGVIG